jgi:rod shape-determining protein MreC
MVEDARMAAADVSRGFMEAGANLSDSVSGLVQRAANLFTVYEENDRLRAENAELLGWREKALDNDRRIEAFKSVLNISYTDITGVTAASVIADTAGPFARAIIVNAGARQGVRKGDAALDSFGLVGRVIAVGQGSSRVLLLTDTTSRVPVLIEPNGVRAMLTGEPNGPPSVLFVPPGSQIADGSAIVTSGDGGVLPPGLPVGVLRIRADGHLNALLYSDVARIDVVAIKRYDFLNDVDVPALPMADLPGPVSLPDPAIAANPGGGARP